MLPAYGGPGAFAQAKLICFILDTQAVSNYIYIVSDYNRFVKLDI